MRHAVGERDRGRAVPGLHQARVVLVERALLLVHRLVPGPRLRDHHHHRVGQGAAGQDQQLEHVVEHRGVAALGVHHGQDLPQVVAERLRLEQALPRVHPVDVAAQGVDLAVVADQPVGVRARPVGEGVGREARVHHGQRRLDAPVHDVGEVGGQLGRDQHPLVDEGAVRQAGDVEGLPAGDVGGAHRLLDEPPQHVEPALPAEVLLGLLGPGHERLPHDGLGRARGRAEQRVVGGDVAPAEEGDGLLRGGPLEELLAAPAGGGVPGQEHEPRAVAAGAGQRDAGAARLLGQEGVRHLHQDAGAVAGVLLAAAGSAVLEVQQHLDRLVHDRVRPAAVRVHHEADPARVVLEARVVEPLRAGASEGGAHAGVSLKNSRCRACTARSASGSSTTTEMFTSEAANEIITTLTSASASKMRRARPA